MDPQKLSQLDPKLRDAYQRVMGTVIPEPQVKSDLTQAPPPASPQPQPSDSIQTPTPPPSPTSIPDPTPQPQPQPEPEPASIPTPQPKPIPTPAAEPEPFFKPQPVSEPSPAINPQPEPPPASNFVQMNSEVPAAPTVSTQNFAAPAPQAQTIALKKKSGMMMPVLFGIVGLVFIAIYTLFWTKIFNFKLPFLP